jgi:hypothetical protein
MGTSKVRQGSKLFSSDPVSATEGAVTSWFSLAHPESVITGSGYSNVHDILNPSSPLTQSTDARRPPNATSANGYPIVTVSTAAMALPIIAARSDVTTWGFWAWVKQGATANNMQSYRSAAGASVNRHTFFWQTSGTEVVSEVTSGAGSRFVGTTGHTAGAWNFLTLEFNGNRSGDARCIITVNAAVPATLGYATGSGITEMPATLNAVTGTSSMFALGAAGPYFVGSWGTNFGFFGAAMSGAEQGLLTTSARLALMNYQRPT